MVRRFNIKLAVLLMLWPFITASSVGCGSGTGGDVTCFLCCLGAVALIGALVVWSFRAQRRDDELVAGVERDIDSGFEIAPERYRRYCEIQEACEYPIKLQQRPKGVSLSHREQCFVNDVEAAIDRGECIEQEHYDHYCVLRQRCGGAIKSQSGQARQHNADN